MPNHDILLFPNSPDDQLAGAALPPLEGPRATTSPPLRGQISLLLNQMGLTPLLKGYSYLRESIELCVQDPESFLRITKALYPAVAQKFGTTPQNAERAMRHAIARIWQAGNPQPYFRATGSEVLSPPANGQFIALLAQHFSD